MLVPRRWIDVKAPAVARPWRALLACVVALTVFFQAPFALAEPGEISVAPSGDRAYDLGIQRLAESAEREISLFLVSYPEAPPVVFYSVPDIKLPASRIAIRLDRNSSELEQVRTVVKSLIRRRLPKAYADQIRPWLTAGICHRALRGMSARYSEDNLQASMKIAAAGHDISLEALLKMDISPKRGPLYAVYADVSAAFLQILHRQSITAISRITAIRDPITPAQLEPILELQGVDIQSWFTAEFRRVARASRMTPDVALSTVEAGLREHLFNGNRDEPLDRLLSSLDAKALPLESRREWLTQCYQLRQTFPELMLKALDQMITAATYLNAGKDRNFMKQIQVALTELQQAHDHAQSLLRYLRDHSMAAHESVVMVGRESDAAANATEFERRLNLFLESAESPGE